MNRSSDHFPAETAGLPEARKPELFDLADGGRFSLRIAPVAKRLGDATVRMLGYNGSIPGPTLRVKQGTELVVDVFNDGDLEATVHWHGLRLQNRYDGTPETQRPIPIGGSFTYRLQFPDPGVYWYHPHIREDYGQEMGLYGNILVVPSEPDYWPPVNREVTLTLNGSGRAHRWFFALFNPLFLLFRFSAQFGVAMRMIGLATIHSSLFVRSDSDTAGLTPDPELSVCVLDFGYFHFSFPFRQVFLEVIRSPREWQSRKEVEKRTSNRLVLTDWYGKLIRRRMKPGRGLFLQFEDQRQFASLG